MHLLSLLLTALPVLLACAFAWSYWRCFADVSVADATLRLLEEVLNRRDRVVAPQPPGVATETVPRSILARLEKRHDPMAQAISRLAEARERGQAPNVDVATELAVGAVLARRRRLARALPALLVSGLLGTLVGLSASIGKVGLIPGAGADQLDSVLSGIGGSLTFAFLPSIAGVSATLVGVLAVVWFDARHADAFLQRARQALALTLATTLFPAPSQAFLQAVVEGQRLSQQVADHARELNRMASALQQHVDDLLPKVEATRATLTGLARDSLQFSESTKRYAEATAQLTGLQTDIKAAFGAISELAAKQATESTRATEQVRQLHEMLQKQLEEDRRQAHELLRGDVRTAFEGLRRAVDGQGQHAATVAEEVQKLHKSLLERLEAQRTGIEQTLQALRAYEDVYIKGREITDAGLGTLIETAKASLISLGRWDQDMLAKVVAPLNAIHDRFEKLNPPIAAAVDHLRGTARALLERQNATDERLIPLLSAVEGTLVRLATRLDQSPPLSPSLSPVQVNSSSQQRRTGRGVTPPLGVRARFLSWLRIALFSDWRL